MRNFFSSTVLTLLFVLLLLSPMPNRNLSISIRFEFAKALFRSCSSHSRGGALEEEINGREKSERNGSFENATTLEDIWRYLKRMVPNRGTNGYIEPKADVVVDFERIVLDMMMIGHSYYQGSKNSDDLNSNDDDYSSHFPSLLLPPSSSIKCNRIDLRSLKGKYKIGSFVDRENGRSYCVLATTSILYPWGNVIVDLDASSVTKNLSFDCPHPKFDVETGEQGIRLLKGTTARSWIVSGSHRMANNYTLGTCQPEYYPSDAAHSIGTCFLAAVAAVKFYYESVVHQDYTSVQLHGMGESTCGSIDTFFSHGSCSETVTFGHQSGTRKEKIDILQGIARAHPLDNGRHVVAGRGQDGRDCDLCGSNNIQGRLINGVARKDLCHMHPSSYNGRFIQIEQKRGYRRDTFAQFWNDVFNESYPLFPAGSTI